MNVTFRIRYFFLQLILQGVVLTAVCSKARAQADTIPTNKPAVVVAPKDNFIQRFDDRTLISLALSRTPAQTPVMRFLSTNYRYFEVGVPAGLLIGGILSNDRNMRENAGYVASSTLISYGFTMLVKTLVKRPRPFVRNLRIVPVYIAGESSFPSGHTSSSFATATALSSAYPKWYVIGPSFLWAGATSYSRMYLGVHYPTDVLGGAVLGTGSALLLKGPLKQP
ncbi:PAP2 family protein [Mucilaginibacter terrenus]|uniref:PAP2 family protein n=1 Tax=Mucilaginibacter terrenus TaxID=2482727 RepID=A0A3E2NVV0_9SPHI|nr:phosphatase PAP2 family protein [Mucilaginibacter terrenus]RFZ85041.1 PAP2 family protein [Mucilaginibacter terrenus]